MTPEQRKRRLLESLPQLLQRAASLQEIMATLAGELTLMESGVKRLLRGRWLGLAEGFAADEPLADKGGRELARIGALFDLGPDGGEDDAHFRDRITSMVELRQTGFSTAPGLLRLVSLVYLAKQPIVWDAPRPGVTRGKFAVPDGEDRLITVEIVDNPQTAAGAQFQQVKPYQQISVNNGGLDAASAEIRISAPSDAPLAAPALRWLASNQLVTFSAVVPPGQTLVLRDGAPPLLDNQVCAAPVLSTSGTAGRFAAAASQAGNTLAIGKESLFAKDLSSEAARFAQYKRSFALPPLVPGESLLQFETLSPVALHDCLGGLPGGDRIAPSEQEALLEQVSLASASGSSPRARIEVRWTEVTPATFSLRIPQDYLPERFRQDNDWPGLMRELQRTLRYGMAAGVRARIEFWVALTDELSPRDGLSGLALDRQESAVVTAPSPADHLGLNDALVEPTEALRIAAGTFDKTQFDTDTAFRKDLLK